eukprot:7256390-Karenia_brevis.AAC.1
MCHDMVLKDLEQSKSETRTESEEKEKEKSGMKRQITPSDSLRASLRYKQEAPTGAKRSASKSVEQLD